VSKKKTRRHRFAKIVYSSPEAQDVNITEMSPCDLREPLKEIGVNTRVRNVKRLQELYRDALDVVSEYLIFI
jgi:hypothetical protein